MKRRSIEYLISQQLAIGVKKQSSPSINDNVPILILHTHLSYLHHQFLVPKKF